MFNYGINRVQVNQFARCILFSLTPSPLAAIPRASCLYVMFGKRESNSRPNAGIVSVKTIGRNQHGGVVFECERSMLIPKQGHAVDDRVEY